MCVRISGIQLLFPFSRACNLPVPVICSGCQPVSHTFPQNDFLYDHPARAQTVCSYRTDLDPFSPPFCLNLITLHLGECHYKLWGYNSVVSNECSIKQRAPTRQTGPNKANLMLSNWHSLFSKSHWSLESTIHVCTKDFTNLNKHLHPALLDVRTLETALTRELISGHLSKCIHGQFWEDWYTLSTW